jgi:RTX calcium-binding nonapeptide repeat (4 copies)
MTSGGMAVRGPKRAGCRPLLRGGVAACAALLACAAPAGASSVSNTHDAGTLPGGVTYAAGAGEVNHLTVSGDAASVLLGDAVAIVPVAVVPAPPAVPPVNDCVAPGVVTASCPLGPLTVTLGDQNDTIATAAGAPAISVDAGAGNDVLLDAVRSPGTAFNGDVGVDRSDYTGRGEPLSVSMNGIADDGASGEGDNIAGDEVIGGSGDDTISGNSGANGLVGGDGNDFLTAGIGDDSLDGGAGNDTLDGGPNNDTLRGGDGADQLIGAAGADLLVGGPGPDAISGGDGNDTISAADGVAETINCGAGIDTVVADLGAGGATDTRIGCENVTGPAAPPVAPGAPGAPAPPTGVPPGLVAVLAPGVANPSDLTPPGATLRKIGRQRLRAVLARGVPLQVACAEACGVSIALSVERAAARRLGLDSRSSPVVVATGTARRSTAGPVRVRAKFTRRAKTALRRSRRLTLTAQVLVSDASGNGTLLTRRFTLVRRAKSGP